MVVDYSFTLLLEEGQWFDNVVCNSLQNIVKWEESLWDCEGPIYLKWYPDKTECLPDDKVRYYFKARGISKRID